MGEGASGGGEWRSEERGDEGVREEGRRNLGAAGVGSLAPLQRACAAVVVVESPVGQPHVRASLAGWSRVTDAREGRPGMAGGSLLAGWLAWEGGKEMAGWPLAEGGSVVSAGVPLKGSYCCLTGHWSLWPRLSTCPPLSPTALPAPGVHPGLPPPPCSTSHVSNSSTTLLPVTWDSTTEYVIVMACIKVNSYV